MSTQELLYNKSNATKCRQLVGKTVFVLWKDKNGKEAFYEGKVTDYDITTDKHTVTYLDGDVKEYNMWRKTFSIFGEGHKYTPSGTAAGTASSTLALPAAAAATATATTGGKTTTGGTTTGATTTTNYSNYSAYSTWERKFPGYNPKKAGVATEALFSCYLDRRCLESGDRVVLLGSCDQLGGWGQGIVLDAHPQQDHVWQVRVQLPFEPAETCITGIFEFKFGIRTAGGQLMTEGGQKRLVETMASNFYANYRHTTARRYRSVQRASNAAVATVFLYRALTDFETGACTAVDVLNCFEGVDEEFEPTRTTLMALLNRHIKSMPADADQTTADMCVLLVTSMIGKLGRTSREKPKYSYSGNYYAYNSYASSKAIPKDMTPSPWCMRAIQAALRVQQGWDMHLHQALGSKTRAGWCAEGLKDAVERLRSTNGAFYDWMEIIPIIHRYHTSPTFSFTYNKYTQQFRKWASKCMGLVDEHRAHLASLPPVPVRKPKKPLTAAPVPADSAGGSKDGPPSLPAPSTSEYVTDETGAIKYTIPLDNWMKKNSKSALWIEFLMHYAPSLEIVCELLKQCQDHPCAARGLLATALRFAFKWIGDFPWEEVKELNQLSAALDQQPLLRSPSIISHILNNKNSDAVCKKPGGLDKVLGLLRFCLAVPVPLAKDPNAPTALEEDAYFGDAIRGAKAWFHRRHGSDDDDDDDDDDDGFKTGGTGNWGWTSSFSYSSSYKKKKTPAERKASRLARIVAALTELDFLFRNIPCFATNPQHMIYELNRCTFMTAGDRKDTIELLSLVAARFGDMAADQLSPVLGSLLQQKATTLITDYFSSGGSSPARAKAIADVVCTSIPKTGPTALFSPVVLHAFVSSVAQGITKDNSLRFGYYMPSEYLSKFLGFSDMFSVVLGWALGYSRNNEVLEGTPLKEMLVTCLAAVQQLAHELGTQSIRLSTLHVVVDKSREALALIELARKFAGEATHITASDLAAIRGELAQFDLELKTVQCFLTTFCNCGVPTEMRDMQARIDDLTRDYDSLEMREIGGKLGDALERFPDIPRLYALRTSEVFLGLWRTTGEGICSWPAPPAALLARPAEEQALLFASLPLPGDSDAAARVASAISPEGTWAPTAPVWKPKAGSGFPKKVAKSLAPEERQWLDFVTALSQEGADEWISTGLILISEEEANSDALAAPEVDVPVQVFPVAIQEGQQPGNAPMVFRWHTAELDGHTVLAAPPVLAGPVGFPYHEHALDEGDELVAVNGRRTVGMPIAELRGLLLAPANPNPEAPQMQLRFVAHSHAARAAAIASVEAARGGGSREEERAPLTPAAIAAEAARMIGLRTYADDLTPLDAEHICRLWLPRVLHRWQGLQASLRESRIEIFGLETTFGSLANGQPTRLACLQELALILGADASEAVKSGKGSGVVGGGGSAASAAAAAAGGGKSSLPTSVVDRVSDFVLLLQIRRQVPALLGLFHSFVGDLEQLENDLVDNDILRIVGQDETVTLLMRTDERLNREWSHHTLASIGSLIDPIRPVVEALSHSQLVFLSHLGGNPILTRWLATHRKQDEFNQLLQVCRPCTDEPRLLASIASLVHVRTVLRTVLYVEKDARYNSFSDFLERFGKTVDVDTESLEHIAGLSVSFEALLDVFEKQTKAPGIKSCYDLVEIHTHGLFVLSASQNLHEVLCLEYAPREETTTTSSSSQGGDNAPTSEYFKKPETLEYLLDLRSKLMMTEISKETDEETNVVALLAAFAEQLEVLIRIRDQIHSLCIAGHFAYQEGFRYTFRFDIGPDALQRLQANHADLKAELVGWNKIVEEARDKYFFLNFYTMQEIWALRKVLTVITRTQGGEESDAGTHASAESDLKLMLHLVTSSPEVVNDACDRLVSGGEAEAQGLKDVCADFDTAAPGKLLYSVGAVLQSIFADASTKMYRTVSALDQSVKYSSDMLVSLRGVASKSSSGGASKDDQTPDDGSKNADGSGSGSSSVQVANVHAEHPIWVTTAEKPGLTLDMVLSVYIRRGRLPEPGEIVFCLPSTSTEEVELLLRRYIKARTNHREDAIFCLVNVHNLPYTTQVGVVKVLKTFISRYGTASASGLLIVSGLPGQVILSSLSSYAVDLPPLELGTLQQKCTEFFATGPNSNNGGTTCVRSRINGGGKSHYILNAAVKAQREANDAGRKIKYFRVGYREATNASTLVHQLSSKLSSLDARTEVDGSPTPTTNFFHLDIGHIVPQTANTVLFQLLFVGVLSDQRSGLIYHRDPADAYMIEVSNSPLDKTAEMLRVCRFLPNVMLEVSAETLEFNRPEVVSDDPTHVICPDNDKLRHACKTLKALDTGKYRQGEDTFQEELDVEAHVEVTQQECFSLICKYCGFIDPNATGEEDAGRPAGGAVREPEPASWALVANFINYVDAQFRGLEGFGIWNFLPIFVQFEGAEGRTLSLFRDRFLRLVIETTRDFAMRAVPRGRQYMAAALTDTEDGVGGGGGGGAPPLKPPLLRRSSSSNGPREPGLTRQLSNELHRQRAVRAADDELVGEQIRDGAARFERMANWEDTDHPVAILYPENRNPQETGGLDVFALNRSFTSRFIDRNMAASLADMSKNGIKLDKDWSKMTNAEGRAIISKLAGVIPDSEGMQWAEGSNAAERYLLQVTSCESEGVEEPSPGYVLTADNLLKMLSIFSRIRAGLPVIIMGETGCGKSSLIRQMCALAKVPLHTLNIHGGMDDAQVLRWMRDQVNFANQLHPQRRLVVFLDEVNTCNSMALFKEVTCDRTLEGVPLPQNLTVIAACNPYRLRKHTLDADKHLGTGLVYGKQAAGDGTFGQLDNIEEVSGITDPLEDLVYRVHPLPESMVDHVFDFGSLSAETEQLYINSIIKTQLKLYVSEEEEQKQIQELAAQAKQLSMLEQLNAEVREPITRLIGQLSAEGLSREAAQSVKAKLVEQLGLAAQQYEGSEMAVQLQTMMTQFQKEDREEDTKKKATPAKPVYGAYGGTRVYGGGRTAYGGYSGYSSGFNWGGGTWGGGSSYTSYFRRKTFTDYQEFVKVYADLICAAQEFVRSVNSGERSSASLRDVARCVKIFRWFGEHFARVFGAEEKWTLKDFFGIKKVAHARIRQAVFMSIAYCYHARLGRELREGLRQQLEATWQNLQKPTGHFWGQAEYGERCQWLRLSEKSFKDEVQAVERDFVRNMTVPAGIAMNEALCENLFMILVSVLNRIPIFVVGKPGSSKSLAMGLIQSNLNGENSDNAFLRALPSVEVFSYQCSPLSTSGGIEQVFEAANRYKAEAQDTVVVVLLDEVGLAEQSPHLPLKVLHKLLDEADGGQAVVGISNWALDPAKMNRAVHLYRPAPTPADLAVTARGIVQGASLKGYLDSLANAYHQVYKGQTQADFWGLREFYSLVKKINRDIQALRQAGQAGDLQPQQFLHSIQRNFGGRPREMELILETFFQKVGMLQQLPRLDRMPVLDLIVENLKSQESRHLMILTKNNVALSLLYDYHLLGHEDSEVIFGSDFPLDQSDLQICLNIQRIKNCMAQGRTAVLIHCEGLYESLYDLLNQHYTEYSGQLYVRLAFGTSSRLCPLVKEFRVVVIVDQVEAYTQLPPPLLNRFEKQVLARKHLLTEQQRDTVARLQAFVLSFVKVEFVQTADGAVEPEYDPVTGVEIDRGSDDDIAIRIREAFCGYHGGMLLSLAQSMDLEDETDRDEDADGRAPLKRAIERLLWCATPEAASKWMSGNEETRLAMRRIEGEFGVNILYTYFKQQRHSNLPVFVRAVFNHAEPEARLETAGPSPSPQESSSSGSEKASADQINAADAVQIEDAAAVGAEADSSREPAAGARDVGAIDGQDALGAQAVILTFAPFHHATAALLNQACQGIHATELTLHQLSSERDLQQHVGDFFAPSENDVALSPAPANVVDRVEQGKDQLLILHCDPIATSVQRIEHAKYIIENIRASIPKPTGDNAARGGKRHICLLVHLPRGQARQSILVDFNKRWQYAFVDAIDSSESNGMPDVQQLLEMDRALHNILPVLDLEKVFVRVFRNALANLIYPYQRFNQDVTNQIATLLNLIAADHSSSPATPAVRDGVGAPTESRFLQLVRHVMAQVMKREKMAINMSMSKGRNRDLLVRGTFQNCLHHQILTAARRCLTLIVAHAERNSCLALIDPSALAQLDPDEATRLENLWYRLYRVSLRDELDESTATPLIAETSTAAAAAGPSPNTSSTGVRVTVKADGKDKMRFQARFPFSFYVAKRVESQRGTYMQRIAEDTASLESALRSQVLAFRLELSRQGDEEDQSSDGVDDALPPSLLDRYLHDFACMYILDNSHRNVEVDVAIPVLRFLLQQATGQPCSHPSDFHVRYWKHQERIDQCLRLLNTLPALNQQNVLKGLLVQDAPGSGLDASFDLRVARLMLCELEAMVGSTDGTPWAQSETSAPSALVWNQTFVGMDEHIVHMLDELLVTDGESKTESKTSSETATNVSREALQLCAQWEKLCLFGVFLRDIGIPLGLTQRVRVDFWRVLSGAGLRTHALFENLFAFLQRTSKGMELASRGLSSATDLALAFSRFVDVYISDYVFTSPIQSQTSTVQANIDSDLLKDIISLLSQTSMTFGKGDASSSGADVSAKGVIANVSVPESSRVSLMRTMLSISFPSAKALVDEFLLAGLQASVAASSFLDAPLCVCYTYVREATLTHDLLEHGPNYLDHAIKLAHAYCGSFALELQRITEKTASGHEVRSVLEAVAVARTLYNALADALCNDDSLGDGGAAVRAKIAAAAAAAKAAKQAEAAAPIAAAKARELAKAAQEAHAAFTAAKERQDGGDSSSEAAEAVNRTQVEARRAAVAADGAARSAQAAAEAAKSAKMAVAAIATPAIGIAEDAEAQRRQKQCEELLSLLGESLNEAGVGGYTQSLQLYLLKGVERRRGLSYLRSVLARQKVAESAWCMRWKASAAALMQFAGSSALPTSAPMQSHRGVDAIAQGVNAYLESEGETDINLFVAPVASMMQSSKETVSRLPAALMVVLFRACYCLRAQKALPERVRVRVGVLRDWLLSNGSGDLQLLPLVHRMLLRLTNLSAAVERDAFYIGPDSSTEDILKVRVLVHVAAASTIPLSPGIAASNPILGFFTTLLFSPQRLAGSYLPQMPEDELAYVMKVLGGRWYRCQNGHAYYVDLCGRPTQINKCATCGCDIGGLSHNLLETNQDIDESLVGDTNYNKKSTVRDNSKPNYFLPAVGVGGEGSAGAADVTASVRGTPPSSCRAQRLLLHAALMVGTTFGGTNWRRNVLTFCGSVLTDVEKMPQFFGSHFNADWARLKTSLRKSGDDAELLVHSTIMELTKEALDSSRTRIFDFFTLPSRELRAAWESEFSERILQPLLGPDAIDSSLERLKAAHHDKNEQQVGRMLQERPLWSYSQDERVRLAPALFRFRPAFSVEDFVARISDQFKLLKMFMTQQRELQSLRHLGDVLRWERLLTVHYNRRISSSDAATMTVARVLETVGRDQLQWHRAWQGFQNAWALAWQFVSQHTCTELPAMYKQVTMGPEATINLCLPAQEDAGICATALTTYLTTKHNEVVDATQAHLRARGRGQQGQQGQQSQPQEEQISSQMFSHIHAVSFNTEKFIEYVQRHCLIYSQQTGQLEYDFDAAERWLVDVYFATCPSVRLEMDRITYLDEQLSSDARAVLRAHVPQVELPPDIVAALAAEFHNPTVAHSCIEALDLVLVFMQEILRGGMGKELGNTNLANHMKSVLLTNDNLFKSKTLCSEVKVKHVDALYNFLWSQVSDDDFAQVQDAYKVKLTEGFVDDTGKKRQSHGPVDPRVLDELRMMAPRLDLKSLVECMARLMEEQLSGTNVSPSWSIHDAMLPYEDEGLPESFDELFPDEIMMGHFVEVYRFLDNLNTLGMAE